MICWKCPVRCAPLWLLLPDARVQRVQRNAGLNGEKRGSDDLITGQTTRKPTRDSCHARRRAEHMIVDFYTVDSFLICTMQRTRCHVLRRSKNTYSVVHPLCIVDLLGTRLGWMHHTSTTVHNLISFSFQTYHLQPTNNVQSLSRSLC